MDLIADSQWRTGVASLDYRGSIISMKLSVSLPEEDVEFVDEYARANEVESRSAVIRRALRMLRSTGLEDAYVEAWDEWNQTEAELWEVVIADGLANEAG